MSEIGPCNCASVFLRFHLFRFIFILFYAVLCVFAGYSTCLHMISCVCIVWCVFLCFCALGVLLGATCVSVIAPCSASCVILFVFMYSHVFSCVFCLLLLIFMRFCTFLNVFKCFCGVLRICCVFLCTRGALGLLWAALGARLGALGAFLGTLGALLEALGALLGRS